MDDIKNEIIKRAKMLRKEYNFSLKYVASYLDIEEEEYARFESGDFDSEYSYFIITSLAYLYNVSVDYMFGRGERRQVFPNHIRDTARNYEYFIRLHEELFYDIVSSLDTITDDEFAKLEAKMPISKFNYTGENGAKIEIAMLECYANTSGYYFVLLNGSPEIAYLETKDSVEYFVLNKKIYPLKFNDIQILGMLYAKIKD